MNTITAQGTVAKIRDLNDAFRTSLQGGRVMRSSSIAGMPDIEQERIFEALKKFDDFNEGNDPNGEHDMALFDVAGSAYIAKIDYYDTDERFLSDDPSDPQVYNKEKEAVIREIEGLAAAR